MFGRNSLVVWFVVIAIVVTFSVSSAQEIEFKFNPPDGISYFQTMKHTKVTEMGGQVRTEITDARAKITVQKTESGFDVFINPQHLSLTQNGQPVNNPVFDLMTKLQPVYHIDADGQMVSIEGFDEVASLIEKAVPAEVAAQMTALLNEEMLVKAETAEWNGRVGDFAGAVVNVGDVFHSEEAIPLPVGGTANYHSITKIIGTTPCGDKECVRVGFSYNSNPEELAEFMGDFYSDFIAGMDSTLPEAAFSDVQIAGHGDRLVDPATMLIMSESSTRTMTMQMQMAGQEPTYTTVTEDREYTYEY